MKNGVNRKNALNPVAEARMLIWFGVVWTVFSLLIGGLIGHQEWINAKISAQGRTAPAKITGVETQMGGDGSVTTVHYVFTLPSGETIADAVASSPKEVESKLGIAAPFWEGMEKVLAIPARVEYLPRQPGNHRLQGFSDGNSGSPLIGNAIILFFVTVGGIFISAGVRIRREARATELVESNGGGGTVIGGLPRRWRPTGRDEISGKIPGYIYRQEGELFVFKPTWASLLLQAFLLAILGIFLGFVAVVGAGVIHSEWLGLRGLETPDVTTNNMPPSHGQFLVNMAGGLSCF